MRISSKQALSATALSLFFAISAPVQQATAQVDNSGTSNLNYNGQYKNGIYTDASYDNMNITYADFYDNLANYGQWIDDQHYGYVWSPDVPSTFRPYYTNGYWAMTNYGNTWVSEYQWGWACFHYGRWTFDAYYGWLWIPGTTWGPAWVSWRSGPGYFGWAPLAPDYEYSESELKQYNCPKDWWIFIPPQYVHDANYYNFYSGPLGNSNIIKATKFNNNVYVNNGVTYFPGPTSVQIEKITGKPVKIMKLHNAGGPRAPFVHNDLIKMFRPNEVKATGPNSEPLVPPNPITTGRAISKPEAVNVNAGMAPAFKADLPGYINNSTRQLVPTKNYTNNLNAGGTGNEVHRADKTEYKTDIMTPEPQRKPGPSSIPAPKKVNTPAQGTQRPEPVTLPQREDPNKLPPATQHNDPTPTLPAPSPDKPKPTPMQHPEPIPPSNKH